MMEKKTTRLRALLAENDYLVAPCAYDAVSALAIQKAGFRIAGTTGNGMHAAMLGAPDLGLLALDGAVDALGRICDAVDIPVLADAEGGYGNAMNVLRTVRAYEKAGVAGYFIEDQKQPPNCPFIKKPELISTSEMVGKIEAALSVRSDPDLLLIARTDAPFEEAIERANAYLAAGADMVKIVPKTRQELEALPGRVNGPLHLGMFPGKGINDGLTARDCGGMGYKIVTFPLSTLLVELAAITDFLAYVRAHETDEGYGGAMLSLEKYFDLVGVPEYKSLAEKYLRD